MNSKSAVSSLKSAVTALWRRGRLLLPTAGCQLLTVCLAVLLLAGCGVPRLTPFEKGVEYMDHSDYPRALEEFKTDIKLNGERMTVCYNIGVCYHDTKDYEQAAKWYEKALSFDPRDGDTLVNLAMVYLEQGRDLAALAKLKQAADVEKDRAYPLIALGIYHQRTGELDKAREFYEQGVKREEKSGYAWYHYATLHELDQRFGDAAQCYEKSAQYDSTNPASYQGAARCYFKLRNWRKAIANYEFAIHLVPDRAELYLGVADTLVELKRYDRAVQYLWAARGLTKHDDKAIHERLLKVYPLLIEEEKARGQAVPKQAGAGE